MIREFKKSSSCEGGTCVEVKFDDVLVTVRDSGGGEVYYSLAEWGIFVQGVKNNEFDV